MFIYITKNICCIFFGSLKGLFISKQKSCLQSNKKSELLFNIFLNFFIWKRPFIAALNSSYYPFYIILLFLLLLLLLLLLFLFMVFISIHHKMRFMTKTNAYRRQYLCMCKNTLYLCMCVYQQLLLKIKLLLLFV